MPSQTALPITLRLYNSSNPSVLIDSCSASLTFQALAFSTNALSYAFEPGNVSSPSNLTLTVAPFTWDSTKMKLHLHFLAYWSRNLLNVTANQVVGGQTYCTPTCAIQDRGSFFVLELSSLSLTNGMLSLKIFNILSPATLEIADTLSVSRLESTYNSDVQTGTVGITSTFPNNMQVLSPVTTNIVGEPVSLTLTLISQDLFSSSDNIQITFNTSLSMAGTVTIVNPLVSNFAFQIQQNYLVSLSTFTLVTSMPSQFDGSITINNISSRSTI